MTAPLVAPAANSAPATSGVILPRAAWGAGPPAGWQAAHHHPDDHPPLSGGAAGQPQDRRAASASALPHGRQGWIDIAYHYAVDRNGNIFALRDTAIAGDTATDYDTAAHFLVLCGGDFDEQVSGPSSTAPR